MIEVLKNIWESDEKNDLESMIINYFKSEKLGSLVVTKKVNNSEFFEEEVALGFNEESFFYEFLSQDKGDLKKYLKSSLPISISGEDKKLFFGKKSNGLFIRIFHGEPIGFIFIESQKEFSDEQILVIQSFAKRLAEIYSKELLLNSLKEEDVFDLLLEKKAELKNRILKNNFLLIQGSEGTGKKLLVEKIYKELNLEGKIFYEYSLPESEKKIRESIDRAIQISEGGIFVFEEIGRTSKLQQEIFYNYIINKKLTSKFIFLSSSFKIKEESKSFWDLIRFDSIHIPDLVEIEFTKLKKIIDIILKEESIKVKNPISKIEDNVYEFLFHRKYKKNLIELIEVLNEVSQYSKEGILKLENLPKMKIETGQSIEVDDLDLRKATEKLERNLILIALKKYQKNQVRMAKALGISRGSLQYKMKQLEIGNELD